MSENEYTLTPPSNNVEEIGCKPTMPQKTSTDFGKADDPHKTIERTISTEMTDNLILEKGVFESSSSVTKLLLDFTRSLLGAILSTRKLHQADSAKAQREIDRRMIAVTSFQELTKSMETIINLLEPVSLTDSEGYLAELAWLLLRSIVSLAELLQPLCSGALPERTRSLREAYKPLEDSRRSLERSLQLLKKWHQLKRPLFVLPVKEFFGRRNHRMASFGYLTLSYKEFVTSEQLLVKSTLEQLAHSVGESTQSRQDLAALIRKLSQGLRRFNQSIGESALDDQIRVLTTGLIVEIPSKVPDSTLPSPTSPRLTPLAAKPIPIRATSPTVDTLKLPETSQRTLPTPRSPTPILSPRQIVVKPQIQPKPKPRQIVVKPQIQPKPKPKLTVAKPMVPPKPTVPSPKPLAPIQQPPIRPETPTQHIRPDTLDPDSSAWHTRSIHEKLFCEQHNRKRSVLHLLFGKDDKPMIKLMKLVFEDPSSSSECSRDIFIYYHNDNYKWIIEVLLPGLQHRLNKKVNIKDDIPIGSDFIQEVLESIHKCRHLLVALSNPFIYSDKCRFFTEQAYYTKPHALIPLALPPLDFKFDTSAIFRCLVRTNGLIQWSDELQDQFWKSLEARLKGGEVDENDYAKFDEDVVEQVRRHEIFVFYHHTDKDWVDKTLIHHLETVFGKKVTAKKDDIGKLILEAHLDSINHCEHLILVLSQSFLLDEDCCKFTVLAYGLRPHVMIPMAIPLLNIDEINKNELFGYILRDMAPFLWSRESVENPEHFWMSVKDKLGRA